MPAVRVAFSFGKRGGFFMKKRIFAFLAVLVMLVTMLPGNLHIANAAEELILKLHYHRADGNYDGWDVWLWEAGKDG